MQSISSQIEPKKEQFLKFLSCLLCSMGAHYRKGNDPTTQQDFEIKRIIIHEHCKKPFGMSNDIALLKLSTPAKLNKRVGLACLPDKSVDLPINDINKKCWITGMKCFFNPVQRDVSGYLLKKLPVWHHFSLEICRTKERHIGLFRIIGNACVLPDCLGLSRYVTKCIDREGLGRRRTGTRRTRQPGDRHNVTSRNQTSHSSSRILH